MAGVKSSREPRASASEPPAGRPMATSWWSAALSKVERRCVDARSGAAHRTRGGKFWRSRERVANDQLPDRCSTLRGTGRCTARHAAWRKKGAAASTRDPSVLMGLGRGELGRVMNQSRLRYSPTPQTRKQPHAPPSVNFLVQNCTFARSSSWFVT